MAMEIMPVVDFGTVKASKKGWISIRFMKTFPKPPSLVAMGEYREGRFTAPSYTSPTYTIARPTVETEPAESFGVEVPKQDVPDFADQLRDGFYRIADEKLILEYIDEPVRRIFLELFSDLGYYTGSVLRDAIGLELVGGQTDKVQAAINLAIKEIISRTNSSTNSLKDSTSSAIKELADTTEGSINDGLAWVSKQLTDVSNKTVENLYKAMGMEKGMLMTPPLVRNITTEGFEFYSLGAMTLHYFAIASVI